MKLEITMTYLVDAPEDDMHRADALDYAEEVVYDIGTRAGIWLSLRDVDMVKE